MLTPFSGGRRGPALGSLHHGGRSEVKRLAKNYTVAALQELGRLALQAESEQVRVSAIKELLDRGWGKATQPITGEDGDDIRVLHRIERVIIDAVADSDT
jgi:hypothetical protein